MKARLVPVLLIQHRKLVKTTQFANPRYIGDPLNAVRMFNDMEADELVLLDISRRGIDYDYIGKLASECFMPVCYGGGVRHINDMRRLYRLGVEKVSLCSALSSLYLLAQAGAEFGAQSVVACIDAKVIEGFYHVMTQAGRLDIAGDIAEFARRLEHLGAGEILLQSIDRDGMMDGYDLPLISQVANAVSIPVIACGGARDWGDFEVALEAGASACAAGSAFVFFDDARQVNVVYPERGGHD